MLSVQTKIILLWTSLLIVYDTQNGYIFTAYVKYPSVLSRMDISRPVVLLLLRKLHYISTNNYYVVKLHSNRPQEKSLFLGGGESSLTNKCTFINLKNTLKFKIYIRIDINIAPRCFGLRQSSATQSPSAQHTTHTPFHDMLPHNRIIDNDVISPNILT